MGLASAPFCGRGWASADAKSPNALSRSWTGILTLRAMFTTGKPLLSSRHILNPSMQETFNARVPPAIEAANPAPLPRPWVSWGHGAVLEPNLSQ